MPKYIGKLAEAELHPGVAVLRDVVTGKPFYQAALEQVRPLMGNRKEVYYLVSIHNGAYHLDTEIPVEDLSKWIARLYTTNPQ